MSASGGWDAPDLVEYIRKLADRIQARNAMTR
jgi:hypothetical protein